MAETFCSIVIMRLPSNAFSAETEFFLWISHGGLWPQYYVVGLEVDVVPCYVGREFVGLEARHRDFPAALLVFLETPRIAWAVVRAICEVSAKLKCPQSTLSCPHLLLHWSVGKATAAHVKADQKLFDRRVDRENDLDRSRAGGVG